MERNRRHMPGRKHGRQDIRAVGRLDNRKRRRNARRLLFILFMTALALVTGGFGALPDNPVTGLFRKEIADIVPAPYLEGFNSLLVSLSESPIEPVREMAKKDVVASPAPASKEVIPPPTEIAAAPEPPSTTLQIPTLVPTPPTDPTESPVNTTPNPSAACSTIDLTSPKDDILLPPDGRIVFSWSPAQDAVSYKLEITLPSNDIVVFDTTETSRVQYIEALAMGGRFQWKVTAFDANGEIICSSNPFRFEKPQYIPPGQIPNRGGKDPKPVPSDWYG